MLLNENTSIYKDFLNHFETFFLFFFPIHCCEEDHVKGECKWQGGTLPLLFKRVTNNPLHPSRLLALTLRSLDPSFPSTGLVFPGGLDALWVQEMQAKQRLKVSRSKEKGRWQKRLRRPNPPLSNASSYKDLLPLGFYHFLDPSIHHLLNFYLLSIMCQRFYIPHLSFLQLVHEESYVPFSRWELRVEEVPS